MLVLASSSPRRQELLRTLGITSFEVIAPHIDETPLKKERPQDLVLRLAQEKALKVFKDFKDPSSSYVLAADTVLACGRRILPTPVNIEEASRYLDMLSGGNHRAYTGVCLIPPSGELRTKLVTTRISFKHLSYEEKQAYLDSKEWEGRCGGYAIHGFAGAFIKNINGSFTNVMGLPLYETRNLLMGCGFPVSPCKTAPY